MVYMFTLSACGGHDGGIGDGGAVVSADCAGQAGGHADYSQFAAGGEYIQYDGNQDAEGAPGGAGGECNEAGYDEDDGGQEIVQSFCAGQSALYKTLGVQHAGHGLKAGSHGEYEDCGHHCDEALRDALHGFLEADKPAAYHVHDGNKKCCQAAQRQAYGGIGIAECGNKVVIAIACGIVESAYIDKCKYGEHDKHDYGQYQVHNAAAPGIGNRSFLSDHIAAEGEQIAVWGVHFMQLHGAVIKLH